MKYQVMVTTLFSGDNISNKSFYYARMNNGKTLYCDAMMPAEASCKFVLATTSIDEIIIVGSETMGPSGEEPQSIYLRDSVPASTASLDKLTRYELLCYRLSEFMDDVHAETQDIDALLSDEEEAKIVAFVRGFFDVQVPDEKDKPSRYFHLLAQDRKLLDALHKSLREIVPEADYERFRQWLHYRLYLTLKATYKMELLENNANVRIRFIPAVGGDAYAFLKRVAATLTHPDNADGFAGADLYMCLQNSEATVTMNIVNFSNLIRIFPDNQINLRKTFTTTFEPDALADQIVDDSQSQAVNELLSAIEAFLRNGKAGRVVEFWKKLNVKNDKVDSIVYSMRNIDNGISLCDFKDIERGVKSLRNVLQSGEKFFGDTPLEQLFGILLDAACREYEHLWIRGMMEFIDLVRLAYQKEFWQQTLTIIESRAPEDFVEKGFYYYCDSEDDRTQVSKVFAKCYYDLRPFEKYKLEDVSHYYIKYYNRDKSNRQKHGREHIQDYAQVRANEIGVKAPGEIRACTVCPDKDAVRDLLFAYYYVGEIRNQTNHATETFDGFQSMMADSDSSERMEAIRQSIDYFLHCYYRVAQLSAGKAFNVVEITSDEFMPYVDELRQQNRDNDR